MEEQLTTAQSDLMKKGIGALPFSTEFKELMQQLGFKNLEQVSKLRIEELEQMDGFHKLLIYEYGGFMVKNNLGEFIEP